MIVNLAITIIIIKLTSSKRTVCAKNVIRISLPVSFAHLCVLYSDRERITLRDYVILHMQYAFSKWIHTQTRNKCKRKCVNANARWHILPNGTTSHYHVPPQNHRVCYCILAKKQEIDAQSKNEEKKCRNCLMVYIQIAINNYKFFSFVCYSALHDEIGAHNETVNSPRVMCTRIT